MYYYISCPVLTPYKTDTFLVPMNCCHVPVLSRKATNVFTRRMQQFISHPQWSFWISRHTFHCLRKRDVHDSSPQWSSSKMLTYCAIKIKRLKYVLTLKNCSKILSFLHINILYIHYKITLLVRKFALRYYTWKISLSNSWNVKDPIDCFVRNIWVCFVSIALFFICLYTHLIVQRI